MTKLKTKLTYSILINRELKLKLWFNDNPVSSQRFEHLKKESKITCFTDILLLLEFLHKFNTETLLLDEASYFIDKLKDIESPNDLVNSKLLFLIEQLNLAFVHNKHRPILLTYYLLVYRGKILRQRCIDKFTMKHSYHSICALHKEADFSNISLFSSSFRYCYPCISPV